MSGVEIGAAAHNDVEHFPDPLRAPEEWRRVARRRVVVVVPHRDRTFDADRETTAVAELLERRARSLASQEDKHWSVWTCESFLEMCSAADCACSTSSTRTTRWATGSSS